MLLDQSTRKGVMLSLLFSACGLLLFLLFWFWLSVGAAVGLFMF
jgi:hypothetical protein